jgi:hypothetical protein
MGDCKYCGKSAGLLRSVHKECELRHQSGKAEIVSLMKKAARDASIIGSLRSATKDIARGHFINISRVQSVVVEGWEKAVEDAFNDGILTEQEESNLTEIQKQFNLGQNDLDKNGAFTRVIKGAVLRDILSGKMSERIRVEGNIPFNFQKGEKLIWIFQGVNYYEQKTRRHYEGGYAGASVRVAKGLYFRTGGFRGYPVERTETVHLDTGTLAITSKHIYFAGSQKSFRIPYSKIVSYQPYSDGIGVQREAATAKPQTFMTGDGWFTYNLIMNLSQL